MPSHKIARISSDILRNISSIIANESRDNLLKTITITGCNVANDLSHAKVYFTSLSDLPKEDLEREMKEAAPYIRSELAKKIEVRHTPALNFIYDESIEYGNRIEKIIEKIHKED